MMTGGKQIKSERKENTNRFSDLIDCLLLHILSFLDFRDAIRTSVLSKRWRHLWQGLTSIILHSSNFGKGEKFGSLKNCMSRLQSLSDGLPTSLHTLDFKHTGGSVTPELLGEFISYAISRNAQQLLIYAETNIESLKPSIYSPIFSCETLTFLKLSLYHENDSDKRIVFPNSPNMPSLTSLHLANVAFCARGDYVVDPFSTLKSLKNLIISHCTLRYKPYIICISSATLSSLTIRSRDEKDNYAVELSTSNLLSSFAFEGVPSMHLLGNGLSHVKQVYIDAYTLRNSSQDPPQVLLQWLRKLTNVQSLTVTANTLQVLSLIPDLLKIELPPISMGSLKSLNVKMKQNSPPVPSGTLNFLLQNSPSAEVSMHP
ncbi:hypothetical protein RIF29_12182 [Crotalaria pallida]|uniref:F-box domain-containing protein n=1 Tax=Crotalaria pallida TaxID=3830 RepID=A0AAN9IMX3_CROPI